MDMHQVARPACQKRVHGVGVLCLEKRSRRVLCGQPQPGRVVVWFGRPVKSRHFAAALAYSSQIRSCLVFGWLAHSSLKPNTGGPVQNSKSVKAIRGSTWLGYHRPVAQVRERQLLNIVGLTKKNRYLKTQPSNSIIGTRRGVVVRHVEAWIRENSSSTPTTILANRSGFFWCSL